MQPNEINLSVRVLRQLYFLRNATLLFLAGMMGLAVFYLDIQLPMVPLAIVILTMGIANLITRSHIDSKRGITERTIFLQLLMEVLSFSLVFYFAGGATNPFTFFYLIPLAIAATLIPGYFTWLLTLSTVVIYSLLLKFYLPLEYIAHGHDHGASHSIQFNQHVLGMWFGFLVSALLVTWFITYLSKELKRRELFIHEARQREFRDQQMVALGTLAASTAHELGTPLASLSVVSAEITQGYSREDHAELFEQQQILQQQIKRCKNILSNLSENSGISRANEGFPLSATEFIDRCLQGWAERRPHSSYHFDNRLQSTRGQLLWDYTIGQAVINLLDNAADSSSEPVDIVSTSAGDSIEINILDQGPGISDDCIAMAGQSLFSDKPDGMGIGLFLSINTIQRMGGDVIMTRRAEQGTETRIRIPVVQHA